MPIGLGTFGASHELETNIGQADRLFHSEFMHAGQEFDHDRLSLRAFARGLEGFFMQARRNDHLVAGSQFERVEFGERFPWPVRLRAGLVVISLYGVDEIDGASGGLNQPHFPGDLRHCGYFQGLEK